MNDWIESGSTLNGELTGQVRFDGSVSRKSEEKHATDNA
jgi:hypothetical protein